MLLHAAELDLQLLHRLAAQPRPTVHELDLKLLGAVDLVAITAIAPRPAPSGVYFSAFVSAFIKI